MESILPFIAVFIGVFFTDVCWTFYLLKVEERKSFQASTWAMLVYLMGAIIVTTYVENRLLIIPAVFGSFFGTYVVMEYNRKKEFKNKKNEKNAKKKND